MSIPLSEVNQNFVTVDFFATVQYTRNQIGADDFIYVVVNRNNGQYAVFVLAHLVDALQKWQGGALSPQTLNARLDQIPGLFDQHATVGLDIDGETTTPQAKKQGIKQPAKLLVAEQAGAVVGVFEPRGTVRSGLPSVDTSWLPAGGAAAPAQPGVLSASDSPSSAAAAGDVAPADDMPLEPRFINVELLDDDYEKLNPEEKPLDLGEIYTLSFFVDAKVSAHSIVTGTELDSSVFDPGQEDVLLTVQLESEDFEIENNVQNLRVPRTGKSKKARFDIKPLKNGPAQVNAVILKDGAFVQVITLKFHVGPLLQVEVKGREVDAAPKLKPRDVNITILETAGGFTMIMSGPTAAMATLPITKEYLNRMINKIRGTLHKQVVFYEQSGMHVYQNFIQIPDGIPQQTLPILAKAGATLYRQLFYGPGHDMQANLMGDKLKEMARGAKLHIQIFSQQFMLPWGLLYVGDDFKNPDPEMFLGLKHVIEHIPLQPKMQVLDRAIDTSDGLQVALNMNKDIDAQMGRPIIQNQIDYWDNLTNTAATLSTVVRESGDDVVEALEDMDNSDEILYFYCHAESFNLDEEDQGGPTGSRLLMTNHAELTLEDLAFNQNISFGKAPLVFINACESAELSPLFYDGFVPYFMAKGARGVIGTECETPALFAEEWANRFFKRFLTGQKSLGELFLELRREFYYEDKNILGLLYALYVDGDTYISDPVLAE